MKFCKYCHNEMYLDDWGSNGRSITLRYYNCSRCGSCCDETTNAKGQILNESWFNPNENNYKLLKPIIDNIIECSELTEEEKEELKKRIDNADTYVKVVEIMNSTKLNVTEKYVEIGKEYCVKILKENPNYGDETKKYLEMILMSKENIWKLIPKIAVYMSTHDLSK